jgi:hypothetical protein
MSVRIRVEGLSELLALVQADELLVQPFREAMERSAKIGEGAVQRAAPRDTGYLASRAKSKVQKKNPPRYFVITNAAQRRTKRVTGRRKSPNPFPYGKTLNFAAKFGHHRWFYAAVESKYGAMGQELDRFGASVAKAWGR